MEVWQIVLICILMFPAFLALNYYFVKKAAANRRSRDEQIERAVSDSVAASFANKSARYQSWPKYKAGRKKKNENP
jgi:hypothetical protein